MGTVNPPSDGDDVAKVTPLRRRDPHLVVLPTVRDPLPAESSVWDTDDPGEPPLRRARGRHLRRILTIVWRSVRSLLSIRPLSVAGAGLVLACVAVTAIALGTGSGPVTRPPGTVASSLEPHGSPSSTVSAQAVDPARHPARHQARDRVQDVIRHRRASVKRPRATPRHSSAHASNATQSAPPTLTTTAPAAPSTPVSASAGGPSTVVSSSNTSQSIRPAGPTGSGAAFGPGY